MSLIDMVDKVLAQKRELDAKSKGCFAFHSYTQGKAEHPNQPTDKKGVSCYPEAPPVKRQPKRYSGASEKCTNDRATLIEDAWTCFQERAGIAEHDGKMNRGDAERLAFAEVIDTILYVEPTRD